MLHHELINLIDGPFGIVGQLRVGSVARKWLLLLLLLLILLLLVLLLLVLLLLWLSECPRRRCGCAKETRCRCGRSGCSKQSSGRRWGGGAE